MNIIPVDTYKYTQRLWKVLKTNYNEELANRVVHELFDNDNFGILKEENIDITREFQRYRENRVLAKYKITQMTLPHRFGMYKNLKNAKKFKPIELETPTIQDNTDGPGGNHNPNHKRRSIFPIDPEK